MLNEVVTGIQQIFYTIGCPIAVPVVTLIIALIVRVDFKKALKAALMMGIGLTALDIITIVLWGTADPVLRLFSQNTGKVFDVVDIGWPAASAVVYSNVLALVYMAVGLVWNTFLFNIKITDTYEPTDMWNYYYFVAFGIMVQFATGSFILALLSAMVMNLFLLLTSDILAPTLQEYYGYEGLTNTCFCTINISYGAAVLRWLFAKLGIKKKEVDADKIQSKIGFVGEASIIGLIVGIILAVGAYINDLGSASTWFAILRFALVITAMFAIYPTISGLFVKGVVPISTQMNMTMRSKEQNRKYCNIAADPALFFGEASTLTTGLILIPILLITAFLLPGNNTIPLADITAIPFMAIGAVAVFHGDIIGAVVTGTIWYSACHYIASDCAVMFTRAAVNAGVSYSGAATGVVSWCVTANPVLYGILKAFTVPGSMKFVWIGIVLAIYILAAVSFKKNRKAWYMFFGAGEEFVDRYMADKEAESEEAEDIEEAEGEEAEGAEEAEGEEENE